MSLPDSAEMLAPLPGDPAGEDCEYDSLYMGLESLATPVEAQEMGDSVIEGRDPDYRKLQKDCEKLWTRTRDLRVASYFTVAAFCNSGLPGLRAGLEVISFLIDSLWDEFWPRLDPDDDNDPTERVNILNMLSPKNGAFSDPIQFISHFRKIRLVDALPYTLRDLLISDGTLEAAGGETDSAVMQAQLRSVPASAVKEQAGAAQAVMDLLGKIADGFNAKAGNGGSVSFDSLETELKRLIRFYGSLQPDEAPAPEAAEEPAAEPEAVPARPVPAMVNAAVADIRSYRITNRADALMLIEKCSEYFRKAEPSSPLPFLLDRALRMADMNFVDILAEIDQDSLGKVREQLGVKPAEN
ncbi:MAG: type VI secretion system protein TssA [Succinivibrionaceae bacterium]|nr:type VI secretion system protein TssA [Pseudomonadota bacterium]MDD6546979.1 type VI secretion system protein TssA [Pseudomonadota bacterium]MDY3145046.1 type VI secretion system protein TssA [Succinivibrionaceae bacterium]